jgi:hypothetical protein
MALAVGAGYALVVAATTPFTLAADVATAVPLAACAVAAAVRWPRRPTPLPPLGGGTGPRHPYLPWVAVVVALVGWEFFNYLAPGSRADHPTLSSMVDAVNRFYGLKAAVVLAWLALGWMLVRRGAPSGAEHP